MLLVVPIHFLGANRWYILRSMGRQDRRDSAIRDASPSDFDAICALNLAEVQHTSAMEVDHLVLLDRLSCYHRVGLVDGQVAAFLLAMCQGGTYENVNFEWFAQRYPRFMYVDRVVVSAAFRGLGLGSLLYKDLFAVARGRAIPVVTCEYNIVPPNEPSRVFHDKLGFEEQGTQWLVDGSKRVSLQALVL